MEMCTLDGCDRELNRDGLCFFHKIRTLGMQTEGLTRERMGVDVTGGRGTREYVRSMYETRKKAGLPPPEPENKKAARYVPREKKFL